MQLPSQQQLKQYFYGIVIIFIRTATITVCQLVIRGVAVTELVAWGL